VTPEFPAGTYHYYVTDTYPFIQRCLKGTYTTTGGGPPGDAGMGGPPDGGGSACSAAGMCAANQVCCPTGQPCAGMCVPDCRTGGTCPTGLTCDASLGICKP
jgi:hypothetical protein